MTILNILRHDPLRGRRTNTNPEDAETVTITLHTSRPVKAAWVRSEPDNEEFLSPLTYKDRGKGRQGNWFICEGELRLNPVDDVTRYAFKVTPEGAGQVWLSEYGQTLYFPERFFYGDPSNNAVSGGYLYEGETVVAKA